jgi:hypothetical protein
MMYRKMLSVLVHQNATPNSVEEQENVEKLVHLVHPMHVEFFLGERMGELVSIRRHELINVHGYTI